MTSKWNLVIHEGVLCHGQVVLFPQITQSRCEHQRVSWYNLAYEYLKKKKLKMKNHLKRFSSNVLKN